LLNKFITTDHYGFPLANPHSAASVDFVPDENIGKNLEEMCIRRGNLKYLDGKTVESNLIIIGHQKAQYILDKSI
jgi:hypothetical protein